MNSGEHAAYQKPGILRRFFGLLAWTGFVALLSWLTFVYVDGVALREPYTDGLPTYTLASDVSYPYTVPEGMMWMMGDNRTNSQDSRYFGAVSVASAEARSVAVLWPLGDVGLLG